MKTWKLTIKEKGNDVLLTPTYTAQDDDKRIDKDFIIWFFGLNEPDVEWYHIEEPKDDSATLKCCICGKEIHGHGNNPYPVKDEGRCCAECNATVVIPERLKLLK